MSRGWSIYAQGRQCGVCRDSISLWTVSRLRWPFFWPSVGGFQESQVLATQPLSSPRPRSARGGAVVSFLHETGVWPPLWKTWAVACAYIAAPSVVVLLALLFWELVRP
jgi:hypothetical protein